MPEDLVTRKRHLRRELRQRLEALPPDARESASARIREHLSGELTRMSEGTGERPLIVGSFAGMADEPDLLPLVDQLPPPTIRWCFPLVQGDRMEFFSIGNTSDFAVGSFGIREPGAKARLVAPVPPCSIDCFLVPGLGFSPSSGMRIGRGKGFYDRYLGRSRPDCARLGIAF